MNNDLSNIDLSGINRAVANSARQASDIFSGLEESRRLAIKASEEREKRENENHDNLEMIEKNTLITIEALQETNSLLKENNALLKEKNDKLEQSLGEISGILKDLLVVNVENGDDQKEQMQQVMALACEISVTLDKGEKINWKDKFADLGVQLIPAVLMEVLKMRGIII
jgi:seryl-tRNA synthetase